MYCMKCGKEFDDSAAFCPHCGHQAGTRVPSNVTTRVYQVVDTAASKLNEATGGEGQVELKFSDFFTEVPKHHTKAEIEHLFICGTEETTPALENVSAEWPKPWVWSRVLLVMLATTIVCFLLFRLFQVDESVPSIIYLGAMTVPMALLIFFFEINIPRNISLVEIISIFFIGGIASIVSIQFNNFGLLAQAGTGDALASILTALIKETGKAIVITFIMSQRKKNDLILKGGRNCILNGLLIGAAVGAGFSLFETAGYAFDAWAGYGYYYDAYDIGIATTSIYGSMFDVLLSRGLFAIGMHTVWSAAEGAALALCEGEEGYSSSQLWDPRFVVVAVVCVACHALWIMYLPVISSIPYLKQAALTVVIWIVIAVLINRGLAQLNRMTAGEESFDLVVKDEAGAEEGVAALAGDAVELIEAAPEVYATAEAFVDNAAELVEEVVAAPETE